jgi:hypothetical protein
MPRTYVHAISTQNVGGRIDIMPVQGASGGTIGKRRKNNVTLCVKLKRVYESPPAAGSDGRRDERQGRKEKSSRDHEEE